MRLADTSFADAASVPLHEHRSAVPTGAGPEIAFHLVVPRANLTGQPVSVSARLLFHDGTDLRAGDFTTTERVIWQAGQPGVALRLNRVRDSDES